LEENKDNENGGEGGSGEGEEVGEEEEELLGNEEKDHEEEEEEEEEEEDEQPIEQQGQEEDDDNSMEIEIIEEDPLGIAQQQPAATITRQFRMRGKGQQLQKKEYNFLKTARSLDILDHIRFKVTQLMD
jgi:hypothetical protein